MPLRDAFAGEHGQDLVGEAAEVGVHHIQRHLHGIEVEIVLTRFIEHAQCTCLPYPPGAWGILPGF